jgi:hypothetical protein
MKLSSGKLFDDMVHFLRTATMQKKFSAYLLLLLLMAASLSARQTGPAWVTYTPPSGKFTALFPSEPKAGHQTTKTGDLTAEVYTYIASEQGINFLVSYTDMDPKSTPSADLILKNAQDHLLQEGGGKMLTSKKTDFMRGSNDRLPMLEFTGENPTLILKGMVIYDGFTNYTLLTFCPKGQDGSAAITKFLSSFKLNPATQQTNDTWVKFTSSEGKFSAIFPTEPKPSHQTVNDQGQTIQINNFVVTVDDMILGVTYTDYDLNTTYPVESGMKAEQDTLLKGFNATLVASARSEFPRGTNDKLPGLEFTGTSNERNVQGVVIVDARRVYVVAFICPKTKDYSAASEKFFSSFKLTSNSN